MRSWSTRGQGEAARSADGGGASPGKRTRTEGLGRGQRAAAAPQAAAPSVAAQPAVVSTLGAGTAAARPLPRLELGTQGSGNAGSALPRLDLSRSTLGTGEGAAVIGTRGDAAPAASPAPAAPAAGGASAGTVAMPAVVKHQTRDTAPAAANTRTIVGVGEVIAFEADVDGTWQASFIRAGNSTTLTDKTFDWYAPSVAGSGTVKFAPADGGAVVLTPIQVLAPQVHYTNPRASSSASLLTAGTAGAIMDTDVSYGPNHVSFANTSWWEQPGPATALSGYFRPLAAQLYHSPAEDDLQIHADNGGVQDTAGIFGLPAPFSAGSFVWSIPTYYKVTDDDDRHLIRNIVQGFVMTANGAMTVSKDGVVSAIRAPGGAASAAPPARRPRPAAPGSTPPAGTHGAGTRDRAAAPTPGAVQAAAPAGPRKKLDDDVPTAGQREAAGGRRGKPGGRGGKPASVSEGGVGPDGELDHEPVHEHDVDPARKDPRADRDTQQAT